MPPRPDDLSTALVADSWRSLFDTAIRVREDVDPAVVLADVVEGLVAISAMVGSEVLLSLEPNGDSCETGHWVEVTVTSDAVWAGMTPWPARFDGTLPPHLVAQLELAGWQMITENAEAVEAVEAAAGTSHEGPCPRLAAVVEDNDIREWAELVADGVYRVIGPTVRRWYLYARLKMVDSGAFGNPPHSPTPFDGEWTVDVGQLTRAELWDRAVWASESEWGDVTCRLGLHEYHRPPCPAHLSADYN